MTGQPVITSTANDRIVAAAKLCRSKHRKQVGATLVEGPHALEMAVAAGVVIREVFITPSFAEREPVLIEAVSSRGASVVMADERVVAKLSETVSPQGVVAVVEIPAARLTDVLAQRPGLLCLLSPVADPGNAGTVVRTADAAGADAVVLAHGSVDVWSGKSIRASAGSVFNLPIVTGVEPQTALSEVRATGVRVLAASAGGDADLDDLIADGALAAPTMWVFGSEGHGIHRDVEAVADALVRVPIRGGAESLNLAAAVAICLFASARALHPSTPRAMMAEKPREDG